jgi:hypothetical protein
MMINFVTSFAPALALMGCFSCAPVATFELTLEDEVKKHAADYTGAIDVSGGGSCFASAVNQETELVAEGLPNMVLTANDIWMVGEVPALPLVGLLPSSERAVHYVVFSRLVVDPSVNFVCDGQPVTEALVARSEMESGGRFTVDEVERLVTEHQTATELPTQRLEALPFEPEEEP